MQRIRWWWGGGRGRWCTYPTHEVGKGKNVSKVPWNSDVRKEAVFPQLFQLGPCKTLIYKSWPSFKVLSSSQPGLFYIRQAQTICLGNVFHFACPNTFLCYISPFSGWYSSWATEYSWPITFPCNISLDDIPIGKLNILDLSHFYAIFLCSLNNNTIGKLNILDLHPEDDEQLDRFRNAAALKVVPIFFEIRQKL